MLRRVRRIFRRPPDRIITHPQTGGPYMRRWHVIPRNPWFNIYLHHVVASDDDRALHDHPWASCSIVLKGGYFELMPDTRFPLLEHCRVTKLRWRRPGSVTIRGATASHRLLLKDGQPSWSLFITGPRVRRWGFHCPKGWVFWEDFLGVNGGKGGGCDQ
jgi:hypothetical protein